MKYLGLPLALTHLNGIHFQPLEDKVAGKLLPWLGKHDTMAGRSTLVKAVLTRIGIYYITILDIPVKVLIKLVAFDEPSFGRHVTRSREENARSIGIWYISLKTK
jgi:hypothetical protein